MRQGAKPRAETSRGFGCMSSKEHIFFVPGVGIALCFIVLGSMVTLWLVHGVSTCAANVLIPGFPNLWEIACVASLAAAMVVLKTIADSRCRLEGELLKAFLEYIPDHVYFKDRNSRFMRINLAMAECFGLADPKQAIGRTDADMFSSEHAGQALKDEQDIISTGRSIVGVEEKETWPDGRESWVLTTKVPLKDRLGRIIGTMGISHNITERKQAEARIHHMALHDALTGLPNRTLMAEMLTQAITQARRNETRVALLMLDLDHFKSVNDTHGHYMGDRLLEAVARRLKGRLRESDIVARLGGDEFLIGIPDMEDEQGAEQVAKDVLSALSEPFLIEGHRLHIGASCGVCQYPVDGDNAESLLQIADSALYDSKKKRRGTYSFFTPELTQATRRRQSLERDLRDACARGEFVLHYQPLVTIDTKQIIAVEALLRWRHAELGQISPSEFVPVLEELELMADVGTWVMRTACLQNLAWQNEGLPPMRLAVNVSAQQFYRGDIVETVKTVLHETGMNPRLLELELTESLTLDNSESSVRIMHELKQIGVSLSLDDFGTGWSSLSYLRRFPLDRLKIDRSFLRDIESQPSAEAVVRSILNLGRNLGLACVAEGVETGEQLAYLHHQKCAEMQGFLFSRPLPPKECAELIRSEMPALVPVHATRGFRRS
jgi:diguanylate cyclase (GGDEF)-like protein/PAS domain S-box-containing protein